MTEGLGALTDKEKQTLRLIVRGHDAKSAARYLDLSVHTINERLRDARRKLAVSSSREAARLLLDHEGGTPDFLRDSVLGDAAPAQVVAPPAWPENGRGPRRSVPIATGVLLMSFALALLALVAQPHLAAPTTDTPPAAPANDPAVEAAARSFLALVDQGRWADSYAQTGASFRSLNTVAVWAAASEKARTPLGAMKRRTLISHDAVPAPPAGVDVVKFRTDFANKAGAIETLSLDKEDGVWRVVGIYIE